VAAVGSRQRGDRGPRCAQRREAGPDQAGPSVTCSSCSTPARGKPEVFCSTVNRLSHFRSCQRQLPPPGRPAPGRMAAPRSGAYGAQTAGKCCCSCELACNPAPAPRRRVKPSRRRHAGRMLPSLTVQQRAQRCRCGRLLAWSRQWLGTDQACYADPLWCRCCRPPNACPCAATSESAEGYHRLDLEHVHESQAGRSRLR
jgi:hypothetical protein